MRVPFIAAAIATLSFVHSASATTVERIVAVVGEQPVFFSELRERARPYLRGIEARSAGERAAIESQVLRSVLERIIDERLEASLADRLRVRVTSEEIDRALDNKAQSTGLDRNALMMEAERQGLAEAEYREEVRRQLLEGKLLHLRVLGRLREPSLENVEAARRTWLDGLRRQTWVDVRF